MSRPPSASLAEATVLLTDGTHYTPPDIGEGVPFLTVKDVSERGLDFAHSARISEEEFARAKAQNSAPEVGDVLFSKDGTVGKVHLVTEAQPFAVLSSLAILRPGKHLDSGYLAHFLRTPAALEAAERRKTGSAIRRIVLRDLASLSVPLPPLDEQRQIATILDKADALRQKRNRAIALFDRLTQSVFRTITTDQGAPIRPLSDALTFVTSGGRNWTKYTAESGARFIRSFDVQNGWISGDDPVFVAAPDNAEAKRTRTQVGDVLLTITGSRIGRVSTLPDDLAGAYVSQHVAILRVDQRQLLPAFLSAFLISEQGHAQIAKWQYGQTKPGLNFDQIRRFEVPMPPLSIQARFTEQREALAERTKSLHKSALAGDQLFASLQHRAFLGQL